MDIDVNQAAGQPAERWVPANDVERRLHEAVAANDLVEATRILMVAPLVLPGFDDGADVGIDVGTGRDGQRVRVRERDGVPYLLVFTSVESMRRVLSVDGWREVRLAELARAWPELCPSWGLAINPATPIVMLVAPENVPELTSAGLADPLADFVPANEVERLLRDALLQSDQAFLDVLVTSRVIVLTDGLEFDGVPTVTVFTSRQRCDEYLSQLDLDVATVSMDLVAVLGQWPGERYQLAVNPGSPIALILNSDRVPGLLGYAGDLIRDLLGGATDGSGRAAVDGPTGQAAGTRHDGPDEPTGHTRHDGLDDLPDAVAQPPAGLPSDGRIADLLRGWD